MEVAISLVHRRLQRPRGGNLLKREHRMSTSTLTLAPVISPPRRFFPSMFNPQMQRAENHCCNMGQLVQILLTTNRSSSRQVGSHPVKRHPLPDKDGEEDGAPGSHEMGTFSLSPGSLRNTAGCARERLWEGRLSCKQAEGKERNEETTNAQARGGIVINNYDISTNLFFILCE